MKILKKWQILLSELIFFLLMADCPMCSFLLPPPLFPPLTPGPTAKLVTTQPHQPSRLDSTLWNEPSTRPIASGQYRTEIFHLLLLQPPRLDGTLQNESSAHSIASGQ